MRILKIVKDHSDQINQSIDITPILEPELSKNKISRQSISGKVRFYLHALRNKGYLTKNESGGHSRPEITEEGLEALKKHLNLDLLEDLNLEKFPLEIPKSALEFSR